MAAEQGFNADADTDAGLQRDILAGRQFSLADVIGKEAGDFMKGASPVPPLVQAKTAIKAFIAAHLTDGAGALQPTLQDWVQADEARVSRHLRRPLQALADMIQSILADDALLYEFVRQVDVKWGQIYHERPYFQRPGDPAHPDDAYTHESVRYQLAVFLAVVEAGD